MSMRSPTILPLAVAAVALWLCAAPAWAGDGGEDAGTIQTFLNSACGFLGMTSCPQLPTISQGVLEVAGLAYARPEAIRRANNIPPGNVSAGNPPPVPANPVVPVMLPVTPTAFSNLALTPLAFVGTPAGRGPAAPTLLSNRHADSLFSAVTTYGLVGSGPGTAQPQVLNLFYEDLDRANPAFTTGQTVALFSFPLVVLNSDGSERPVPTMLAVISCANGAAGCFLASATGDFLGKGKPQTRSAADIGLDFALVFGRSPSSGHAHAIFEWQVPLVVTALNDPVYFSFSSPQVGIIGNVTFAADDTGFTPTMAGILPAGASIGIAPYAAPATGFVIPSPLPPPPQLSTFGFCADLPDDSPGPHARLFSAVAAFLQIATDGETLIASPLGTSTNPTLQCPF